MKNKLESKLLLLKYAPIHTKKHTHIHTHAQQPHSFTNPHTSRQAYTHIFTHANANETTI